jgi:hypothetical protein
MKNNLIFLDLDWNGKTGLTIQIQNPIFTLDCQSQSNSLNRIAIRIEQSSNPIQQYPDRQSLFRGQFYDKKFCGGLFSKVVFGSGLTVDIL